MERNNVLGIENSKWNRLGKRKVEVSQDPKKRQVAGKGEGQERDLIGAVILRARARLGWAGPHQWDSSEPVSFDRPGNEQASGSHGFLTAPTASYFPQISSKSPLHPPGDHHDWAALPTHGTGKRVQPRRP